MVWRDDQTGVNATNRTGLNFSLCARGLMDRGDLHIKEFLALQRRVYHLGTV